MKKLNTIKWKIVGSAFLLLIANTLSDSPLKEHYQIWIFILGITGLLMGFVISYMMKQEDLSEKWVEFVDTISVIWVFFFLYYCISTWIVFPARVNGISMLPTYEDSDIIVMLRQREYEYGDVVFAHVTPETTNYFKEENLLKRVIGTPGDFVEVNNGNLYINHVLFEEPYTNTATHDFSFDDICTIKEEHCTTTIPEGYYFLMGDNRLYSVDSRSFGLVPEEELFGRVIWNISEMIS